MPKGQRHEHKHQRERKKQQQRQLGTVERISMSLPPELLSEFDRSMKKAGFSDRSKAIQTALHFFIDQNDWDKAEDNGSGAGAIMMLYDNKSYSHDGGDAGIHIQHKYGDIISATMHLHLDHENCLETIMVRGEIKKIKDLARSLSENRGIKSLKVNFVAII